jgi:hypothetical protein
MLEPEKACVFFDPAGAERELLVSLPSSPRSLAELWTYLQLALEENTTELESFARQHFGRSDLFVDPIWMPSPEKFTLAIFALVDSPDLYRALTLEPCFSQGAIHLRIVDTVEKHVPLPWEDCRD